MTLRIKSFGYIQLLYLLEIVCLLPPEYKLQRVGLACYFPSCLGCLASGCGHVTDDQKLTDSWMKWKDCWVWCQKIGILVSTLLLATVWHWAICVIFLSLGFIILKMM